MIIIYIILYFIILFIFLIWGINKRVETFGQYLWMPTRFTRLMSYDLRGDPYSFVVFPPYYSYNAPFATYLYKTDRYGIDGKYYIFNSNKESRNDEKVVFRKSSFFPDNYIYKTRKS